MDESGTERALVVTTRLDGYILQSKVRRLVDRELIEEHRQRPFGDHSPNLDVVLNYLRRSPNRDAPRLVLVVDEIDGRWCIAESSRVRGEPLRVLESESFSSREAAEHAVFLRRLEQMGIDT